MNDITFDSYSNPTRYNLIPFLDFKSCFCLMASREKPRSVLVLTGKVINEALSFVVFILLDLLDFLLCFVFKMADFIIESEWKPCYCSSSKDAITNSGKIYVSEQGESKIVRLSSRKIELEEISETLFTRPSLISELSNLTVSEIKRLKVDRDLVQSREKMKKGNIRSYFTVNSTIFEMLEGKIRAKKPHQNPRWSDCDCEICNHWNSPSNDTLFVRTEWRQDKNPREDVLFIHGFISSSAFWTETLFPNFSDKAKSAYRLFAVDLLGFGRSPKPADSLYTLREHLEMIEKSVLEPYRVKSFHIVAHSLGCILGLALAVKYPGSVKSLTLLSPPYYPVPKGEQAAQYVMRQIAPRRVWPPIAMGASIACWYEHISRAACVLLAKNHRLWEFLTKVITRNRIRTFLIEGFFCHTHNAAWHTLHNIICGSGGKLEGYLDLVRDKLSCSVNIFHGKDDEVIPIECSLDVQAKIPRAQLKIIEKKDHITIVVGRQKDFALELEQIWRDSTT